ncbi:MerR family DNA-binding transcriptional regulator [Micromonospora sp. WMMD1120]|uniref:DNA polymerase III subunit beta family protein n=1 Tax=Micromonospora sp. WMMD1120 TaxID=3016106 RepID=UPI0024169A6C|nr:MerR family transcriptional regulator [Micromonospora sp. WMMD1120]MDG4805549.1 MerR family DNA-binding transcriptional regulator [Micromonospora sp. WMMD1120]
MPHVSDLHSIGELARASGLTVSALRFYDSAGVLEPALVDPVTGYRWYAEEQIAPARLVAGLRRIGMPVPEIAAAVRAEPKVVHDLLDTHLRRLADGLADARREVARLRALVSPTGTATTTLLLSPADLAAALDAVRFAVGVDRELPMLSGVLFDVESDGVRLVATDRYRLALARATADVDGPPARVFVPVALVDAVRPLLDVADTWPVRLTVAGGQLRLRVADRTLTGDALPYDFPDYRRLLRTSVGERPTARRVRVDVATLRAALADPAAPTVAVVHDGTPREVTVLGVDDDGGLRLLPDTDLGADVLRVGVDGGYLLDALDAAGAPQLVLELDGPIAPLAVRRPDDADTYSVLMPIRL